MFDPMLMETAAHMGAGRYEQLLRDAEIRRMVRQALPERQGAGTRVLIKLADSLIALGQALRSRHATA